MRSAGRKIFFAVSFCLVSAVWGQSWTGAGATDTVYIRVSVRMVGISFNLYSSASVDRGLFDAGEYYAASAAGDTVHADSAGAAPHWNPCQSGHFVFGLENTGGITIDVDASVLYIGPPPPDDWTAAAGTHPESLDCAGLGAQQYKLLLGASFPALGAGGAHTTPATGWSNAAAGTVEVIDHLLAEDPLNPGDGSWDADENDITDLHVGIVAPPTVNSRTSAEAVHRIGANLIASPAD